MVQNFDEKIMMIRNVITTKSLYIPKCRFSWNGITYLRIKQRVKEKNEKALQKTEQNICALPLRILAKRGLPVKQMQIWFKVSFVWGYPEDA